MEPGALEKKIAKLPDELKLKVEGFVDALIESQVQLLTDKPRGGFGDLKGFVTYMADDFDAPLKDFHDYIYHISIEFIEKIEKLPLKMQQELEEITDRMTSEAAKSVL